MMQASSLSAQRRPGISTRCWRKYRRLLRHLVMPDRWPWPRRLESCPPRCSTSFVPSISSRCVGLLFLVAVALWLWRCGCGCGAVATWLRGCLQLCVSGCRTGVSAVVTFVLWARQQVRQALSRRDWAAVRRLIAEGGNHTVGVATAAHELFVVSSQVASDEAEEELRAAFEHGRIVAPPGGVGDIDLSAISVSVCCVDCVPRPVVQQP